MRLPSVGIIGAGARGMQLSRICAKYDSLRGVAEILPDRLRRVRSEFPNVQTRTSPRKIFASDVDVIAIATPTNTHVRFALEAIACGKHVFVEKPLALSEEGAIAVALKAERAGRSVFVAHDLLYHPAVVAQRAVVQSGTIGEIIHIRARRFRPATIRLDDNVWWRLAPDDMAFIVELLGEPISVSASHQLRAQGAITDFVYADLQFSGERSAHVEVTWLDPQDGSRIDIFGTRGIVSVETSHVAPQLSVLRSRHVKVSRRAVSVDFEPPTIQSFPDTDTLETSLLAFLSSCKNGVAPISNIAHGVATVRALAAVMRSRAYQAREFVATDTSSQALASKFGASLGTT